MWPTLLALGSIKITVFGIALALGFVLTSFLIWRRTREDYPSDDILSLTIVLAVICLASALGWQWWTVGGILFLPGLGLFLWTKKYRWNFWEWLDTVGPASLVLGIIACLSWGSKYLIASLVLLGGVVINMIIGKYYRRFRWYKSGKVGFVGLVSIVIWMIAWFVIANWHKSGVYWGGLSLEEWVGIWAIIASIITLYIRGGRRVTQDWRSITKIWQPKKHK